MACRTGPVRICCKHQLGFNEEFSQELKTLELYQGGVDQDQLKGSTVIQLRQVGCAAELHKEVGYIVRGGHRDIGHVCQIDGVV